MVKYRSMSNLYENLTKSLGLLFRLINILLRKYFFLLAYKKKKKNFTQDLVF